MLNMEQKLYKMETLTAVAKASMSIAAFEDVKYWIDVYLLSEPTVRYLHDLIRFFSKPLRITLFSDVKAVLR